MIDWPYYTDHVFVTTHGKTGPAEEFGRVVWFDMGVGCPIEGCGDLGCNGDNGIDAVIVSLPDGREVRALPNYIRLPSLLEILAIDE